jgi:hypothetical protein
LDKQDWDMPALSENLRTRISRRAATAIRQAFDTHRGEMDRVLERAQTAGDQHRRDLASIQDDALRESVQRVSRNSR